MIPIYGLLDSRIEHWFRHFETKESINFNNVVNNVAKGGEESLHYINLKKYGVDSRETGLYIGRRDIEEAMELLGDHMLESLNVVVNKYLNMWRRRLSNIMQYISPSTGVNISFHPKPIRSVAAIIPPNDVFYPMNIATAAYAAGVKDIYFISPPIIGEGIPNPVLLAIQDILKYGYTLRTDPVYGLAYLMVDRKYKGYFYKYIIPYNIYNGLPNSYRGDNMIGVKPVNRICYLFDGTVDYESLILDIYSWIELLNDVRICLISLSRSALHNVVEEELSLRKRALFKMYSKYIDKMVVSIIASSHNEAIRIINRLAPEYLNINVERDSMYRLVDYIKNTVIITVGKYSLSPYTKILSGMPLLLDFTEGMRLHTCLDYIDINSYIRIDPEAILADYEHLSALLEWLDKPVNILFLRHVINQL